MKVFPYLIFRECNSLSYGLLVAEKGSYNGASRDVEFISVPGRDGDLIIDNGRHKNITIPYKLTLLNNTERDFKTLAHQIKAWLTGEPGYFTLWDSYDPEYFRYAAYIDEVDIEQELEAVGNITVNFNCKPFKYALQGQEPVILTAAATLYNAEAFPSKPYIKITGSGDITLTINEEAFSFSGVEDYIEIDSEIMDAYKGITLLNNRMSGNGFPIFVPGENNIAFTGAVTEIEIIPRWCRK